MPENPPSSTLRIAGSAALACAVLLAGCATTPAGEVSPPLDASGATRPGFDGKTWPDLNGAKVTVLAYGSFSGAFKAHQEAFRNLTNATVELVVEADSGKVLERAVREKGRPSFDAIYGVDNLLLGKALREGIFEPYRPVLASRVDPALAIAPGWEATPVTHGYVAVNVDPRAGLRVESLDDVRAHADRFVTEDPRTSTPGLGFLLATVATYGEASQAGYDYLDYWIELFRGGVAVAPDWTAAYALRFTGGYGQFEEGAQADRAIVTSYTTSPAYEMFYGYDVENGVVVAPRSTFHQVQLMGIAKGARDPLAAQAWIEYCLTEAFQGRVAEGEAMYPVVSGVPTDAVYAGRDPAPGSFEPAAFTPDDLDRNVERWLREWTDAYERARA